MSLKVVDKNTFSLRWELGTRATIVHIYKTIDSSHDQYHLPLLGLFASCDERLQRVTNLALSQRGPKEVGLTALAPSS